LETLVPHAQAAVKAIRLWDLQADRDVRRGDFSAAIAAVGKSLRLGRDLRPRGPMIVQKISFAIDQVVTMTMSRSFLTSPDLTAEHCDRLIDLLRRHEAEAVDPYPTGVKMEAVILRSHLHVLEAGDVIEIGDDRRPVERKLNRLEVAKYVSDNFQTKRTAAAGPVPPPPVGEEARRLEELAANLDQLRPAMALDHEAIHESARVLLAARTYRDRVRALDGLLPLFLDKPDNGRWLVKYLSPDYHGHIRTCANGSLYTRSALCLLALRRWQLTHPDTPPTLEAACKEAGLPGVPTDPYSDAPLKMANGPAGPIIYSVGADGDDDGAIKDSDYDRKPDGDILFAMPKVTRPTR
jgi:hypothetical protein